MSTLEYTLRIHLLRKAKVNLNHSKTINNPEHHMMIFLDS